MIPLPLHGIRGQLADRPVPGFSLVELIIAAAIIAILAGISIPLGLASLRRQRLNNLVIELSGWLEAVSVRAEFAGSPCRVTISTGTLNPGAPLAQVTPASCAPEATFPVPSFLGSFAQAYAVQITDAGSDRSWSFTSRGTIDEAQDIEIRANLNGDSPVRCIQLSADFGFVRLGSNNDANVASASCTNYRRI